MDFHPIANLFPLMAGDEYRALVEDIGANGLLEPITLYGGKILDGRNRYKACLETGKEPRYETFDGPDPWVFVWGENAERRHLPEGQKIAIKLIYDQKHGLWLAEQKHIREEANQRRSEAAREQPREDNGHFGTTGQVSNDTRPASPPKKAITQKRAEALSKARPDLLEKVAAGEISLGEGMRQKKRDEVQATVPPLTGKYRAFYADPPWKYGNSGDGIDQYGPAERHYPPMSVPELCAMPVVEHAEDNAVLFLWVTSPMLEDAFKVIKAWGFEYKTSFIWDKVRHNFGHYNSARHEFLLVCTRGSCTPDIDEKIDSVQSIERNGNHSEKPPEFRAIIDRLYPYGARIELFARARPDGWDVWGNEC